MIYSYPAIIILYHPEPSLLRKNITNVIEAGAKEVLLIDNTEETPFDTTLLQDIKGNVRHIWNGKNIGIASALNIGCTILYNDGYRWVLTLDQDSIVPHNIFEEYNEYLNKAGEGIAILSCYTDEVPESGKVNKYEEVKLCITSGCLMNLDAWNKVGMFDDKLFIDGVDHDICIKFRLYSYKLIRFNYLSLEHKLGTPKVVNVAGHKINLRLGHSPLRMFYMTRNWNYLDNKYKKQLKGDTGLHLKYTKMIFLTLLLGKKKIAYIISMYMGYRDYRRKIFRTYDEMKCSNKVLMFLLK